MTLSASLSAADRVACLAALLQRTDPVHQPNPLLAAGMALEAAALVVPPDAPDAGPVKAALYCRAADCYRAVEHNDFETDADRAKAAWMERNASETARRIACDG